MGRIKITFTNSAAIIIIEDGQYVAKCPEFDITARGATIEKALFNLKSKTENLIKKDPLKNSLVPIILTTFDVFDE